MCTPHKSSDANMTKSISFEAHPSFIDLGKTPQAFEQLRQQPVVSFTSMASFESADSTHSLRRYRRQRQKSSRDIHKTFAQAAWEGYMYSHS